jgi:hypothetical protein
MRPQKAAGKPISLPISSVLKGKDLYSSDHATVTFKFGEAPQVRMGSYLFQGAALQRKSPEIHPRPSSELADTFFPVFSIVAVVLIIFFRNLFYPSFSRYFLSIRNNYEIDLSLQRIGLPATVMSVLVIFFSMIDFFRIMNASSASSAAITSLQILFLPMLLSGLILFFLSLNIRFFPILFPDIKIFFLMSFFLLGVNFFVFSRHGQLLPLVERLPFYLFPAFFLFRTLIYLEVLRKYYRYRITMSLFYICTLNLAAGLVVFEVLHKHFLKL